MASAPQPTLPLFYNDLMPLNSRDHSNWKTRAIDSADFLKNAHAIPLTVDEFVEAQRDLPIIFTAGDDPLPLALMGLNEGINTYVNDKGRIDDPVYLPAYVRRYPFMLAKLQPDAEELSPLLRSDFLGNRRIQGWRSDVRCRYATDRQHQAHPRIL